MVTRPAPRLDRQYDDAVAPVSLSRLSLTQHAVLNGLARPL